MNLTAVLILLKGILLLHVTADDVTADDVMVRLADGETSPFQGRVEVFHQGVWGRVCDPFWGMDEAIVVCRQLGYGVAMAAPGHAAFGEGAGKVWLSWVKCEGTENSISECHHQGWGQSGCGHNEDANVICSAPAFPEATSIASRILRNISTSTAVCREDTTCSLFCYMSSSSPVRYTWTKNDQPLTGDDVIVMDNVIIVTPRGEEDYGVYVCTAANSDGSAQYEITLTRNRKSPLSDRNMETRFNDKKNWKPLLPALVVLSCVVLIFIVVTTGWFLWKLKRKRVHMNSGDQESEQELHVTCPHPPGTSGKERETLIANASH